jgi:hypothetical protein
MTTSPFSGFENAILRFAVPTGESTVNSVGNQVFKTRDEEIKAVLKPLKTVADEDRGTIEQYLGRDAIITALGGHLVYPLALPATIKTPCIGTAIIEIQKGYEEEGKVLLMPAFANPFLMALDLPINKIKVYFKS